MGFFSNASFSDGSSQFEAAPAGAYVCRLANLESVNRPSYDDPNVMLPNFKFTFETTEYGDSATLTASSSTRVRDTATTARHSQCFSTVCSDAA